MSSITDIFNLDIHENIPTTINSGLPLDRNTEVTLDFAGYFRRTGCNGAARIPIVELIGERSEYKKLALLLITVALSGSKDDIVVKLRRREDANINGLLIPKSSQTARISKGISIQSINYERSPSTSIVNDVVSDSRPWFGFIDIRNDSNVRSNYLLPPWVKSAIVFQGNPNSHLFLGKLLLDLCLDCEEGYEGFSLTHQDNSVCAGGYEASFWLAGSDYDQFSYAEYD